jgi:hypothetical protein
LAFGNLTGMSLSDVRAERVEIAENARNRCTDQRSNESLDQIRHHPSMTQVVRRFLSNRGVSVAQLWVTEGNGPATMLYQANGFSFTGAREMLREGSDLKRVRMERRLGA